MLGTTVETARRDVSAVLTTVAEAVTGRELNQVLTQLQPAYAAVFGKPTSPDRPVVSGGAGIGISLRDWGKDRADGASPGTGGG